MTWRALVLEGGNCQPDMAWPYNYTCSIARFVAMIDGMDEKYKQLCELRECIDEYVVKPSTRKVYLKLYFDLRLGKIILCCNPEPDQDLLVAEFATNPHTDRFPAHLMDFVFEVASLHKKEGRLDGSAIPER